MADLQKKYKEEILPKLQKELGIGNSMRVPMLSKIVLNIGVKNAVADKKNMQNAINILSLISGQKPKITKAKASIAAFKIREGDEIGAMVTIRGKRMYDFFEKLVSIVFPRLKDFHGIKKTSFDNSGNYTIGFSEHTVFPEIDPGKVEKNQGIEVTIVTSAKDKEEGLTLLKALGMPFTKYG